MRSEIQELINLIQKSLNLFYCVYDFYLKQKKNNKICPRKIESITEEIYKRTIVLQKSELGRL